MQWQISFPLKTNGLEVNFIPNRKWGLMEVYTLLCTSAVTTVTKHFQSPCGRIDCRLLLFGGGQKAMNAIDHKPQMESDWSVRERWNGLWNCIVTISFSNPSPEVHIRETQSFTEERLDSITSLITQLITDKWIKPSSLHSNHHHNITIHPPAVMHAHPHTPDSHHKIRKSHFFLLRRLPKTSAPLIQQMQMKGFKWK